MRGAVVTSVKSTGLRTFPTIGSESLAETSSQSILGQELFHRNNSDRLIIVTEAARLEVIGMCQTSPVEYKG